MRITIPVGIADAELVKFLSALGPGKLRSPFDAEVIHFTALNDLRKEKMLPPIPSLRTQGGLESNFGIGFTREEISKDLIKFALDHTLFGDLGVVWLRPAEDRYSDLDYEMPPFPSGEKARNLLNIFLSTRPNLKYSGDRDDQERLYGLETITFEPGNLHTRRTKLQRTILKTYLDNINISLGASVNQSWLTSTQEFIVQLPIRDVIAKVDLFIKTHPVDEELKIRHFVSGPGEVHGVEITHDLLGSLLCVTLQAQIGNYTKVQLITSPLYQSSGATDEATQSPNLKDAPEILLTQDWARSYFDSLARHLGIEIPKIPPSAQSAEEGEQAETGCEGIDIPPEYQDEQREILKACVDWVHRPYGTAKSFQEFLDQRFKGYHIYSDKVFYKTHLPKAAELGLIIKVGKFYRPIYKSIQEAYRKIDSLVYSRE